MTSEQKKMIAIGGVFFIVLLLLMLRRSTPIVQQGSSNMTLGGVSLPGFNYIAGSYGPVVMPPIGSNPFDLSMINSCCADCSRNSGPVSYRPVSGYTYINNEGNKGPNIFVYQPPPPPKTRNVATFYQR